MKKIAVHIERNCAWCMLPGGQFVYGKDFDDVSRALDAKSRHDYLFAEFQLEKSGLDDNEMVYNR